MARGGGRGGRCKVTPNLAADHEGTRLLNLTVLRRLDPAVADILCTSVHVSTYRFDRDKCEWVRKAVEGSLFVVKRNNQPRFQFIIMNRRNIENLVQDLLRDFECEVQVPYIMYRNAAGEISGIWFYNPQECEEVGRVFSRINNAYSKVSPEAMVSATRSDFEELEVASAVTSVEDIQSQDNLEEPISSTMVPDDGEQKLLSAFFTAGACTDAPSTGGTSAVQPNQSVRAVPSSRHASPSVISSQYPPLHKLLTRQTSLAPVVPPESHTQSVSNFEELEVASTVPLVEDIRSQDILEEPASSTMVPDDGEQKLLSAFFTAGACTGAPSTGGTSAVQPNQSVRATPSSRHASPSMISSQSPALHNLLTRQTSLAPVVPPESHTSTSASTTQPGSIAKPPFFPPLTSFGSPSFSSTSRPPLHPPLSIQHQQSAPLGQPFPLAAASPRPLYGTPLRQPFPPPNPLPLFTPAPSYCPVLTRDDVRGVMLKLLQNDDFINMVYRAIVEGQYR